MKKLSQLLFSVLLINVSHAQNGGDWNKTSGKGPAIGHLYGKVLDASNKEPVEFASVTLLAMNKDSAVSGCLVKSNGDFSIENIPLGMYRLRIGLVGYKKLDMKVLLSMKNPEKDLGNILFAPDAEVLQEVTISSEKSAVQMSIDHKVYNVDKDISTRGGTGLDAVKNIPSVTIDADGAVSLRNNSVQIYIDGRPTTLTLDQIPADQIDRIEVITNPSAKYDASTTGGILNVIMKKNSRPGYNGMVSAGIGTNDRYTGMINLNVKQGKFNVFATYNYHTQKNNADGYTNRTTVGSSGIDPLTGLSNKFYDQKDTNFQKHTFQNARLGFDFFMNNRNTFTLSGNIVHGTFGGIDQQHFSYLDANGNLNEQGYALAPRNTVFNNYTGMLQYRHTFPKQGKEFTTDITINVGKPQTVYSDTSHIFDKNGHQFPQSPAVQNSITTSPNWAYTYQADYTNPINDSTKIEAGVRSYLNESSSDQVTTTYSYNQHEYITTPDLTNNYHITNLINAAYINYGSKIWGISYQGGLRFEETYYTGSIKNKDSSFGFLYPGKNLSNLQYCFFPSLYLSKKLPHGQEIQLNFSRKVNRPNFMQLAPFILYSDNANIRIGNPALGPEFINLSELNYNIIVGKFNFLSSLYFRYSQNPITSVAFPLPGNPNILKNTFVNGNNSFVYGWDNTAKITLFKNLDIMANANPFYTHITWLNGSQLITNTGYSWIGKTVVSYKFPANFTLQVNGTYQAAQIIPQGNTTPNEFMDITLSKSIKQKLTMTLLLSDVFNTKRQGTNYITPDYMEIISRRRETRFLRFTLSYVFGKQEPLFKRKQKSSNQNSQDDMSF